VVHAPAHAAFSGGSAKRDRVWLDIFLVFGSLAKLPRGDVAPLADPPLKHTQLAIG
jgi:hypothetical protein